MSISFEFDFKNPDYIKVFNFRLERLARIRKDPSCLIDLKLYYKENPVKFINDWGVTFDPRNINKKLPSVIPFILFPKQEEFVHWFMDCFNNGKPGAIEKSRDMGITWICMALVATISLFNEDSMIGVASRKQSLVYKNGDPDCLFYKIVQFINCLPVEFRGGFIEKNNKKELLINIPDTGSIINGEAGDNIGRGGRTALTIIDESAFLERPELIKASLSATTDCRIDVSTPNGTNNAFYKTITNPDVSKFSFHWRDDPRKDEIWYQKKCSEIDDPVIISQELDLDYSASIEGVVIPSSWVQSSINLHKKLNLDISGIRKIGFDVADEGKDLNAVIGRHSILVESMQWWTGKESDIYRTVKNVFQFCDINNYDVVTYDADGLGAGVRGDANNINKEREFKIKFNEFVGSGKVINSNYNIFYGDSSPEDEKSKRTNKDYFYNFKSQSWWSLRRRFLKSYRVISHINQLEKENISWNINDVFKELKINKDDLISISSEVKDYMKLVLELSQPTFYQNNDGKLLINKKPEGSRSPNLADALMIAFSPIAISNSMMNLGNKNV